MSDQKRDLRVDQFILEQIDSVPHLEALLLIWNTRPKNWTVAEMARALYVRPEAAAKILDSLAQRDLVSSSAGANYSWVSEESDKRELLEQVATSYRKELVRISSLIHSKAPAGVRDFARAFRFTKEKE